MRAASTTRSIVALGVLLLAGCAGTMPDEKARPLPNGRPDYPNAARLQNRTGWANLDCTITTAGTTRDCKVTDASAPDFAASALAFVQHARYVPAMRDGVPVEQRHHTFRINYTLPARTVTLNAVCAVHASGEVRNCRVPSSAASSVAWQAGRVVLEQLTVTPPARDGRPVDDPDRAITVTVAIAHLPLAQPMPALPGDVTGRAVLACRQTPEGQQSCVFAPDPAAAPDGADMSRYQVEVGITGVTPLPTGDFAQ